MTTPSATPVRSMTGFGRAVVTTETESIEVDLRSVNHRGLKLSSRVPDYATALLPLMDSEIKARVQRGAVTLSLRHQHLSNAGAYKIDSALLAAYVAELNSVASEQGLAPVTMAELVALPGVVIEPSEGVGGGPELWKRVQPCVQEALDVLLAMREREGAGIVTELRGLLVEMRALAETVQLLIPETVESYRDKLEARIARLLPGTEIEPDPRELAQQLAFFADRSSITEELQRLVSHIDEAEATLEQGGLVGRKLEFLSQELQREANTMISKSHGLDIVKSILTIKLHVDSVREQAANLE